MRLGVIADIHSNLLALEAVLEALDAAKVDFIVDLGDVAQGVFEPAKVLDTLEARSIRGVLGNMDRVFLEPAIPGQFVFERSQLTQAHLNVLQARQTTLEVGDVFCCHGTPASDTESLLERITLDGVFLEHDTSIEAKLSKVTASLVLCGHSHVARTVQLSSGKLVVNPGSVGLPAYDHDDPMPHRMESGSPHARCAIVSKRARGWQVEHLAVPYDWHIAANIARVVGRPDWARWLETGRA